MYVELDAKNQGEVSQILEQIQGGDPYAEQRLVDLLYTDLRKMAAHQLKSERSGHTLQPTALVHEAYFRIFTGTPLQVHNRAHFMALAAQVIRRILVDYARSRTAVKRGGKDSPLPLNEGLLFDQSRVAEFLEVHDALERLRAWSPRQSQIVEMRFFGGMSEAEMATRLNVSERTVKRDWAMARAWLHAELTV